MDTQHVLKSSESSFSEHTEELRRRLKVVFATLVAVLFVVAVFPGDTTLLSDPSSLFNGSFISHTILSKLLARITGDILPAGWKLIAAGGLGEALEIYFVAALVMTLAICMPVVAYETYKFIDPALREEERKLLYPFVASTSLLFVVGLLFGYFVVAKFLVLALSPFFQATGTTFFIDAAAFYYVAFLVIGSSGVSFTLPVLVYSLIRLGILEADLFSRNRVVVWFMIWVVTGLVLTPDGGPLLDLVIFLPIVSLTEAAVWFGRRGVKTARPVSLKDGCKYCGARLPRGRLFCPNCGRSPA